MRSKRVYYDFISTVCFFHHQIQSAILRLAVLRVASENKVTQSLVTLEIRRTRLSGMTKSNPPATPNIVLEYKL